MMPLEPFELRGSGTALYEVLDKTRISSGLS